MCDYNPTKCQEIKIFQATSSSLISFFLHNIGMVMCDYNYKKHKKSQP